MLKFPPMSSLYAGHQPRFQGTKPSILKNAGAASADDVAELGDAISADDDFKSEDIFEFSGAAEAPGPAAAMGEASDAEPWELFPLLPQYKETYSQGHAVVLAPEERAGYQVIIQDGRLFRPDGGPFNARPGVLRYVVDATGQLYMEDLANKQRILSHASYIGDNPVRCAGRILLKTDADGRAIITTMDNESGHYHPSKEALVRFITWLQAQGVTVAQKRCVGPDGRLVFF